MSELIIDRLGLSATRTPRSPLLPERQAESWRHLTYGRAWIESGAVASWLIAQGFGPGAATLSVQAADSPERVVLILGALRAGALVVDRQATVAFMDQGRGLAILSGPHAGLTLAGLAGTSIDAAVAERRLHIDGKTPARLSNNICVHHEDLTTIEQAATLEARR